MGVYYEIGSRKRYIMLASKDRYKHILYDCGKWYSGKKGTSTAQEKENRMYYASSGSNSTLIETQYVYGSTTRFKNIAASIRITYAGSTSTTYNTSVRIGYYDDSDAFVELVAGSVKASVAHSAIEDNGYYIHTTTLGTIRATQLTACKGRKVVVRWMAYFGTWDVDKIWIKPVQL